MIKEREAIVYTNNHQLKEVRKANEVLKDRVEELKMENKQLINSVLEYEKQERQKI